MTSKKPTIQDVARRAGVAIGTASRVINQAPNVEERYRKAVQTAIAELGFVPNRAAQSVRRGNSGEMGIVVRDITVPALAGFVRAAQGVFESAGYVLLISSSENSKTRELELLAQFQRRGIEGLIMTTASESDPDLMKVRKRTGFPMVLFDREGGKEFDCVLVDHTEGVRQSVEYLLSLGHRRILLVTGDVSTYPARSRVDGYKAAFASAGLKIDPALIRTGSFDADFAFTETSAWLSSGQPPTAVIAGGIDMLRGVLRAVQSRDMQIPKDISVIAAADSDLAVFAMTPISVVRWDYTDLGRTAAKMILEQLSGEASDVRRRIMFRPELVIRKSCAPPQTISSALPSRGRGKNNHQGR